MAQEMEKVSRKVSVEVEISATPVSDSYAIYLGRQFVDHARVAKTADTGKFIGYEWAGKIYANVDGILDMVFDDANERIVNYFSNYPH